MHAKLFRPASTRRRIGKWGLVIGACLLGTIAALGPVRLAHVMAADAGSALMMVGGSASVLTSSNTSPLNVARYQHSATLLADNRVIVIGGADQGDASTATAEIFDPATRAWTLVAPILHARSQHTATLLLDGRILVAGGLSTSGIQSQSGRELSSVEIYDATTNRWTEVAPMVSHRAMHTATLLSTGKVLIVGGAITQPSASCAELYDPHLDQWSAAGTLSDCRVAHTAVVLADGTVMIAGGSDGRTEGFLSSTEIYEPLKNTWSAGPAMAVGRADQTMTKLLDGRVLVAGGITLPHAALIAVATSSVEVYDPRINAWTSGPSLPTPLMSHSSVTLIDGRVLVVGGSMGGQLGSRSDVLDPAATAWIDAGPTVTPRTDATAILLKSGEVLVVGGYAQQTALSAGTENAYATVNDYPAIYAAPNAPDKVDQWNFYTRECTSFAAWRMSRDSHPILNRMTGPNGQVGTFGNAMTWASTAISIGYQVLYGVPTAGSVAWWAPNSGGASSSGHVAYSTTVYSDAALVEEYNWIPPYGYETRVPTGANMPGGYINFGANGQQVSVVRHPSGTRVDIFVRGVDGAAWHNSMLDGYTLGTWELVGVSKQVLGAPAGSWRSGGSELDVFAVGAGTQANSNHPLWENIWLLSTGLWAGWTQLSGYSGPQPREEITATRAPDGVRIDLFVRGGDGGAYHNWMPDGNAGTLQAQWESLPFPPVPALSVFGAPTSSWRWDGLELDAFAIGSDHYIYENRWNGVWAGWLPTGGSSGPSQTEQVGVNRKPGGTRLDLLVRGTDTAAWANWMLDGGSLQTTWNSPGGVVLGAPTVSWNGTWTYLDAFAIGQDYYIYTSKYSNALQVWGVWQKLSGQSG
jgi:surface antigen